MDGDNVALRSERRTRMPGPLGESERRVRTPHRERGRRRMARRVTTWVMVAGMSVLLVGSALAQAQAPAQAPAAKKPDGTVKLTEGAVAVGIGWSWGKGTLTYKGKTYPFKVEGLSVLEVGVKKAAATGEVYN